MAEIEDVPADELEALRERAESLQRRLDSEAAAGRERLIRAELKAHAIRAGMVDLDGLKLLDPGALSLDEAGEVPGAGALMAALKRAKPWLFGGSGSSPAAVAPAVTPLAARGAMEMSVEEWRRARAELLRRRRP